MEFAVPLKPDSLIRAPEPGQDRDVTVQLEADAPFTVMKESQLVRTAGGHENDNEIAVWVEYRLDDKLVHRSAHVHLKKASEPLFAEAAALG